MHHNKNLFLHKNLATFFPYAKANFVFLQRFYARKGNNPTLTHNHRGYLLKQLTNYVPGGGLNPRPKAYETSALTTELPWLELIQNCAAIGLGAQAESTRTSGL
jgi:hypothetical protein